MFDIGWTEMLIVAIIAIVFVGPKELPGMLRTFGRSVKKIRSMAGEFQQQFNDAIDEAELDGVRETISDVRNLDPTKAIKDKLNPLKDDIDSIKETVEDFDPTTVFDESKAPRTDEPVKVDVEAALERQKKLDAAAVKAEKASAATKKKAPVKKSANAAKSNSKASKSKAPAKKTAQKPASKKAPSRKAKQ